MRRYVAIMFTNTSVHILWLINVCEVSNEHLDKCVIKPFVFIHITSSYLPLSVYMYCLSSSLKQIV